MTITTSANKFRYQGNGVTDTFAFSGRIFSASDLVVEIITRATDVLVETLTITTDYTVTINSDESASVVVVSGKIPSATQDIQIRRSLAKTQTLDLPTGTVFPAVSVENALDRITALTQDVSEILDRTVTLSVTSSATAPTVGDLTSSEVVVYDGTSFITNGLSTTDLTDLNAISSDITTVAEISSDVTAVASDATDIGTVATNIADINTTADNIASIITAAGLVTGFLASNNTWTGTNTFSNTVSMTTLNARTTAGITVGGSITLGAGGSPNGTLLGNISGGGTHKLINMADGTNAQDYVTKAQLDALDAKEWTDVTEITASADASIDFDFSDADTDYRILGFDVTTSSAADDLIATVSSDGGSSYIATAYDYGYIGFRQTSGTVAVPYGDNANTFAKIIDTQDTGAEDSAALEIIIYNPRAANYTKADVFGNFGAGGVSSQRAFIGGFTQTSSTSINNMKLEYNTGNLTGVFKLQKRAR